jgi:SAM-dependent methyltransferase
MLVASNLSERRWTEGRALLAGVAVSALTSIHHVYGAIRYDTPIRYHAAALAAVAVIAMLGALRVSRTRAGSAVGKAARWAFLGVNATVFVILFGAFEGLYNHVLKDALHLAGTPLALLRVLYPAPMYDVPNDWFFELTGALQVVPAAATAYFVRQLIGRAPHPASIQPSEARTTGAPTRSSSWMLTVTGIAEWGVRVTGVTQVVLGVLFWTNRALTLVTLHMQIGATFVVALWVLAGVAARAGLRPALVLLTAGWGLVIPLFGMIQGRLLPGPLHWVVEVGHLLIGIVAMVAAARLARFIRSAVRETECHAHRAYLPAAGRRWMLPMYDLLATVLGADPARRMLIEQVEPRSGDRVLDIGAGTGTLAVALKRLHPDVEMVALDPDLDALAVARGKAERAAVLVQFDHGFADALPYPDASFDRVTSSLMLHHLPPAEKERALREVRRVLRPGGRLHLLDFDGPTTSRAGLLARRIHAAPPLGDNGEDRVLALMRAAGLEDAKVVARRASRLTRMSFYQASIPEV